MTPLEEILNDLAMKCITISMRGYEKEMINQYAQKIIALIPKDGQTTKCKYSEEQQQGYVVEDVKMVGYNLALANVRRAMGG